MKFRKHLLIAVGAVTTGILYKLLTGHEEIRVVLVVFLLLELVALIRFRRSQSSGTAE